MLYQLVEFINGVPGLSEDFSNETDARIALQQAELAVDAGILELAGLMDGLRYPIVAEALLELEAETFEVRTLNG